MGRAASWETIVAVSVACLGAAGCGGSTGPSAPAISVSPAALTFDGASGGASPVAQSFTVGNGGGGTLARPSVTVAYADGAGWLDATVTGAGAPFTASVRPDVRALATGTYRATVLVSADGASNSPQRVDVQLAVSPRAIQVVNLGREVREDGTIAVVPRDDITGLSVLGAATTTSGGPTAYTVTGVPLGEYVLRVDWTSGIPTFFRTRSDVVDLTSEGPGGAPYAAAGTSVAVRLSGLSPWDPASDLLQLSSWDAGALTQLYPLTPGTGSVELTEAFAWGPTSVSPPGKLLGSTDRLAVAQMRTSGIPGSTDLYAHAVATGSLSGVAMTDGGTTAISATLAAPDDSALSVDWRASAFEAGVQPFEFTGGTYLRVFGVPSTAREPDRSGAPTYLEIWLVPPASDRSIAALPYSAFVPGFARYLSAGYKGGVTRTAPGAASAAYFQVGTWVVGAMSSTVSPAVGPPRAVRIEGLDALVPQTGVGLEPTISWSEPLVGPPTHYRVQVYRIHASAAGGTAIEQVAFLYAGATEVTIPGGLLSAGETYVAAVAARGGGPQDEATPFLHGVPFGESVVVTETFQP